MLLANRDVTMRIRHYSNGKFYLIRCLDGTRVVRSSAHSVSDSADSHDTVVVPFRGQEITIPADPPELLPLLAESGRCGLTLVGEPVPNVSLAGVVCPNFNEDGVSWLSGEDGSEMAHCDYCGCDFELDHRK
jgi:hypothetical protein